MYPLKFQPVFQSRIWGGARLEKVLGKVLPREFKGKPIAESWELADLPAGTVKAPSTGGAADGSLSSVIVNGLYAGRTLREVMGGKGGEGHFPLLVKFLDAGTDVSVQVHPGAAYCRLHPEAHLKSEAWYVVLAEPGARIYKGVQPGVTKEAFLAALETGDVERLLQAIPVRTGDCLYLPGGTVHALGAGCTVVEVQTPSDTTFRVFDWNRLENGKPRQLHIEQAMACIDFSGDGEARSQKPEARRKASCEHFVLDQMEADAGKERTLIGGEPVVMVVIEGQGVINCTDHGPTAFARGDTLLLPTGMKNGHMRTLTSCKWLEARIPNREAKSS